MDHMLWHRFYPNLGFPGNIKGMSSKCRKIEESPNLPSLIRTERGAGYYLNSTVETV